ncbi:hypothetical protein [Moritella viscosa]|uniref:Uncharacterized protein n=1 Tax=Moritella viscosa TaxID=80854 RepID=A0A1L0AKC3_9GAMM|nr:hypothetical protein [Moritella viscosa]SGZ16172.1 Putative uncharacterized protein [Moritella viscosa]SHO28103.1 Putative uncharacterized protein [Moritella viscosa]
MTTKNKGGRPSVNPYLKRNSSLKFNQAEIDAFDKLGLSLKEGVRQAVSEFLAKGSRNEKC